MLKKRNSNWDLFETTVPAQNDFDLDKETIEGRLWELNQQKQRGTLLTNYSNTVQHYISAALEFLDIERFSLSRTESLGKLFAINMRFREHVERCRGRLIPAFYGIYLQDRTLLEVGSKYWQIEATYIRALQTIKDECNFHRRMSSSSRLTKKQRAQFIDRYIGAFHQFFVDTYNFLEELRFRLPKSEFARPIKID